MMPGLKAFTVGVGAAAAVWLAWPVEEGVPVATFEAARDSAPAAVPPVAKVLAQQDKMGFFSTVPSSPHEQVSAAESMAQTHLHGDPESPPIARPTELRERATARELADPKAYQEFESRQTARLYAAYVREVENELPRLRDDIARGRAMGIAPEEIAKAEAKARGLEEMRNQLLKDHPALGR